MRILWRGQTFARPALVIAFAVSALLAGCSKITHAEKQDAASKPAPNPLEIRADESLLKRIKVGQPSFAQVGASLTVAARVEIDETRVGRVGAPVMGRIAELNAREGQEIQRGQLIAVINSAGLSDAQLGLLKAISQQQLAQRSVERAEQLLDAGVIGSAELRRRQAELAQANADVAAARDQLRILGLGEDVLNRLEQTRAIDSMLKITANMDGTILQRKIAIGQVIQPSDTLVEIADLSQVWLVADVPEQSAGTLAAGQLVEAEIEALPGENIRGTLTFVSPIVNADTRTVRVRMDLPNPKRKFKPSMLATMVVRDPAQRRQVVPAAAVVRENNQEHIFVQVEPGRFLLRPVTIGEEYSGVRVLMDGVQPGESIVVDGAFHLNNERKRLAVQGS